MQNENEVDWSQLLVSSVMPLLLPPEDLSNPCLDVLVSEIFSEMIIHRAVLGRASEPWLLLEGVTKLLRPKTGPPNERDSSPTSRLEQFGLLTSANPTKQDESGARAGTVGVATWMFWSIVQYTLLTWMFSSAFVMALLHAPSIQPRPKRSSHEFEASDKAHTAAGGLVGGPTVAAVAEERPIVSMRVWSCVKQLTSLQDRMPWLTGCMSLIQWLSLHGPGRICCTNSALDR